MLSELLKRTGKVLPESETMLHMAKMYMGTKRIKERYSLDAMAAECYPMYSGEMNITSSWLADEGFIVDTEGDIGHTVIMYMLNQAANGGACALGEVGSIDDRRNILALAHEGSTAHSLASSYDKVQISPSGERGCFVGLSLKPMKDVTISSIVGSRGNYKVLVAKGDVMEATHKEWLAGGEKLLVLLHLEQNARAFLDSMMEKGMDHHLVIKEGNYRATLSMVCKFMNLEKVVIDLQ